MKTALKALLFLAFFQLTVCGFASEGIDSDTLNIPRNALILSETSAGTEIFFTLIDLDNSEIVLVYYGFQSSIVFRLRKVIRTGIKIDIEKQKDLMKYSNFKFTEKIE